MTLPSADTSPSDTPNTDGPTSPPEAGPSGITPGWQRAGYAAPDCERYAGNPVGGDGRALGQHGHDADGWHRAGYASPECELFDQLAAS